MTIEIVDESTQEAERYVLHVGTARNVAVVQQIHRQVKFNFGVAGPVQWPEARSMLEGMLHLSVIADELAMRLTHENRTGVRRSKPKDVHRAQSRRR